MTLDVLTCGEAMGVVENERVGPLRLGGPMRLAMAGAESTVAIGVARLGGTARWIGVVGDDEVGRSGPPHARGGGGRDRRRRRSTRTGRPG